YSPRRSGDTVKIGDLFTATTKNPEAESAEVNVALSTLEAARKDPAILVSKLAHEATEINRFYDAFVDAGETLTKAQFVALEKEFHEVALQVEKSVLDLLRGKK